MKIISMQLLLCLHKVQQVCYLKKTKPESDKMLNATFCYWTVFNRDASDGITGYESSGRGCEYVCNVKAMTQYL